MTMDITEAMLRVYDEAWQKAHNAPDAKRGDGRRAGLAAVLALPEVLRAVIAAAPDGELVSEAVRRGLHLVLVDEEAWGLR